MSFKDKTYIIFDGDNDQWAYRYMKGWKVNEKVDFDFEDAHDILPMTYRAQDEQYVKSRLKERFKQACQVIVLIGDATKNLYKYVRWELEVALELGLPIIAVNLNNLRSQDSDKVPPLIRDKYVVHVPFKLKIIKYALEQFPNEFKNRKQNEQGARIYNDPVYQSLGLN